MTIDSVNSIRQEAIDQSWAIYDKNVLGKEVDESLLNPLNPVDKVHISDEAFLAAQEEAAARRAAGPQNATSTDGSVTFDRLDYGQRTAAQRPGAEQAGEILAEPVTATLSGGSTVTLYSQSYEDENGAGTRVMARIDSAGGAVHEFEIRENTVISEDADGNITVTESYIGAGQQGTENNDLIIAFGSGSIDAGDGDNTIVVFDVSNPEGLGTGNRITAGNGNDTVIAGTLFASKVGMGEGDNSFTAKALYAGTQVNAGDGNNTVAVRNSNYAYINLGNGNNTYTNEEQIATHVTTGNGDNNMSIGKMALGGIRTGTGNDNISIDYAVQSAVRTGDGDDSVTISRINDLSFKWNGNPEEGIISNMVVDMGNGNNILKILESADKLSVYSGQHGKTILSLGWQTELTNALLSGNISVQRG